MKVLFLDIDGVLVTRNSKTSDVHDNMSFTEDSVEGLKVVLEEFPDLKIVISSSWKIGKDISYFEVLFKHYGIIDKVIDTTPNLYGEIRGAEILSWLSVNPEVKNFIILDDFSDMGDKLFRHFIKVNADRGFNKNYLRDVRRRLTLDFNPNK